MRFPRKIFLIAFSYICIGSLIDAELLTLMGCVGVSMCITSYLFPVTDIQRFFFSEYIE